MVVGLVLPEILEVTELENIYFGMPATLSTKHLIKR